MWYEFCFGTTMGLGDIEGVVTQGNSSARQINTQNGHPTQILPKFGEHIPYPK